MSKVMVAVLAVLFIVFAFGGNWAYRYYTAPIEGAVQMQENTNTGNFRLQAYQSFYDRCGIIQSYEDSLVNLQASLQDYLSDPEVDRDMVNRLRTQVNGVENQRAREIRRYNQEARQEHSVGQFRSNDLPYQLSVTNYNTTCDSFRE